MHEFADLDWVLHSVHLISTDEAYGRLEQALRRAGSIAFSLQKLPAA